MSARSRAISIGVGVLVLAVIAAIVWYVTRDPMAEVDIGTAGGATSAPAAADAASIDDLAGDWVVADTDGDLEQGTFVGYRVDEELATVGATTAVGRTAAVDGTMTVEADGTVSDVTINADLSQLRSDEGFRDRAIQTQGLQTVQFPDAGFSLDEPISIPQEALTGATVTIPTTGTLTLHGVDQQITVDLEARLVDDEIVAGGAIPIAMSDYDITPPRAQRVISIADEGIAELQVFFARAD